MSQPKFNEMNNRFFEIVDLEMANVGLDLSDTDVKAAIQKDVFRFLKKQHNDQQLLQNWMKRWKRDRLHHDANITANNSPTSAQEMESELQTHIKAIGGFLQQKQETEQKFDDMTNSFEGFDKTKDGKVDLVKKMFLQILQKENVTTGTPMYNNYKAYKAKPIKVLTEDKIEAQLIKRLMKGKISDRVFKYLFKRNRGQTQNWQPEVSEDHWIYDEALVADRISADCHGKEYRSFCITKKTKDFRKGFGLVDKAECQLRGFNSFKEKRSCLDQQFDKLLEQKGEDAAYIEAIMDRLYPEAVITNEEDAASSDAMNNVDDTSAGIGGDETQMDDGASPTSPPLVGVKVSGEKRDPILKAYNKDVGNFESRITDFDSNAEWALLRTRYADTTYKSSSNGWEWERINMMVDERIYDILREDHDTFKSKDQDDYTKLFAFEEWFTNQLKQQKDHLQTIQNAYEEEPDSIYALSKNKYVSNDVKYATLNLVNWQKGDQQWKESYDEFKAKHGGDQESMKATDDYEALGFRSWVKNMASMCNKLEKMNSEQIWMSSRTHIDSSKKPGKLDSMRFGKVGETLNEDLISTTYKKREWGLDHQGVSLFEHISSDLLQEKLGGRMENMVKHCDAVTKDILLEARSQFDETHHDELCKQEWFINLKDGEPVEDPLYWQGHWLDANDITNELGTGIEDKLNGWCQELLPDLQ